MLSVGLKTSELKMNCANEWTMEYKTITSASHGSRPCSCLYASTMCLVAICEKFTDLKLYIHVHVCCVARNNVSIPGEESRAGSPHQALLVAELTIDGANNRVIAALHRLRKSHDWL